MKEIKIKCIFNGINYNVYNAYIYKGKDLVYKCSLNRNDYICFTGIKGSVYKLIIIIGMNKYCTSFILLDNDYTISFNNNLITIKVFDKYYGLPIERGIINLWQKTIQ